jgi:hypothetical protein
MRLEIEFCPPYNVLSLQHHSVPENEGRIERTPQEQVEEGEPVAHFAQWHVPLHLKPETGKSLPPAMIDIHTTVVERKLFVEVDAGLTVSAGEEVNFGQVAVGDRKVAVLRVRNKYAQAVELTMSKALNACGPFSIVNALRQINANSFIKISVAFSPSYPRNFAEVVELQALTVGKHLRIVLRGQGLKPSEEVRTRCCTASLDLLLRYRKILK